jgi:hypothetical protein
MCQLYSRPLLPGPSGSHTTTQTRLEPQKHYSAKLQPPPLWQADQCLVLHQEHTNPKTYELLHIH